MKINFSRPSTATATKLLSTFAGNLADFNRYAVVRVKPDGSCTASLQGPEASVTMPLDGRADRPGHVLLHVATVSGLIAKLETGEFDLSADETTAVLKAGRHKYKLPVPAALDGTHAPELEFPASSVRIEVDAKEFVSALSFVEHASAEKDVRYYLNGVCLAVVDGKLELYASDGHRLAFAQVGEVSGAAEDAQCIVPILAIRKMLPLLPAKGKLVIGVGMDVFIGLEDGTRFALRSIEGRFPDLRRAMPFLREKVAEVETRELIGSLDRALFLHRDTGNKSPGVLFASDPGGMALFFSATSGQEFDELVSAEVALAGRERTLQIGYLRDAAQAFGGTISVEMTEPTSEPIALRYPGREDRVAVIMPMGHVPRPAA